MSRRFVLGGGALVLGAACMMGCSGVGGSGGSGTATPQDVVQSAQEGTKLVEQGPPPGQGMQMSEEDKAKMSGMSEEMKKKMEEHKGKMPNLPASPANRQ